MKLNFAQYKETLPTVFLTEKRFFAIDKKDAPPTGWNKPENQKLVDDAAQNGKFVAVDISGHDIRDDYALIDFDHVLDETTGEFVDEEAQKWFNFIQGSFEGYAERSVSGTGIHIFCKPTKGKFGRIVNKDGEGVLWFNRDSGAKLEIFYKAAARYCLVTGELFNTNSKLIMQDEFADDVLSNILAAIRPPSSSTTEPKTQARRADLPVDVQSLVDAINAITPQELMTKNYLHRSEKGAPEPTGFICPWCGSGTHEHKTGALTFYDEPNPHFACHACSNGGDVIKFLSKVYGIDNRGKDFFALIRRAADDFNITYDPNIFEYKPNTNPDFDDPEAENGFKARIMELVGDGNARNQDAEIYMRGLTEDLDNARRLVKFCGDRAKWLTDSELWLIWNNKGVWEKHSEKNSCLAPFVADFADLMMRHAKKLSETQQRLFKEYLKASTDKDGTVRTDNEPERKAAKEKAEIAKEHSDKAFSIAYAFRKAKKVSPAISMMKGESSILITQDDLDNHAELLNCLNGVVDLQTGKRMNAAPELLLTQQCRAAYDPTAQSELVDKFFRDIMPDDQTRAGLLRWLGYCLTGEVVEEKFMVWTGPGGNGKGVLGGTLLELNGDYGTGLTPRALLKNRNDRDADKATTALNGIELARFALSEELPADAELDCSLVKNLTGGDRINLRKNYGEYRTVKPTAKINISGNYTPKLENVFDGGILRRLLNMPFTVRFGTAENPADPHLKKKLLLPENLTALLALLVREAVAWYHGAGLIISTLMKAATDKHLSQNDFIADFIADNYVFVPTASVKAKDFIDDLRREYPRECARFKRADLIDLIAKVAGVTYGDDRHHCRVFKGIGKLANVADFDGEPVGNDTAMP